MNAPALRFKDETGHNFPEWQSFLMNELGEFKNGINKSKEDFGHGVPFVNLMDVFGKPFFRNVNLGLVNANPNEVANYSLILGDVLFIRSSVKPEGVGETSVILENLSNTVYSGFLIRFREKTNGINLLYKKYCFSTLSFRNQILSVCTTSANTNINQDSLSNISINLPCISEQTKIANFLTAVDEKITQLTQKHDLLNQYKKGVMQQIFSQELRFKDDDGEDFPEWEEKLIGNVIDSFGGTALEEFVVPDGTHHFISIGNYEKTGKYFDNGQRILANEKTKQKLLNKGDLVMVLNDKTQAGDLIGATILIKEDNKFIYNQRSERLVCKCGVLKPEFVWHLFNSVKFRKEVFSISQGGTQIYVNFPSVKKLVISVPSIEEQTKITNFLTAIDDKITTVQAELDAVKQYKQGLLQQMFV